jgi:hypothetical protein
MRAWVLALPLVLAPACRFNPELDGKSLVDCSRDADCPRGGTCVEQVCVAQALRVTELVAEPRVVEAGETCHFRAEAASPAAPRRVRYRWQQVLGPRAALEGRTTQEVSLPTLPGYVGNYTVEVVVSDGQDPPVRARQSCTALVTEDAAFVVYGHDGDCTRDDPCGSFHDVGAQRRIYVGIDEASPYDVWQYDMTYLTTEWNDMELHLGFAYPGWARDPAVVRMRLTPTDDSLTFQCSNCLFSGFEHERNVPTTQWSEAAVWLDGDNITLREVEVRLRGGAVETTVDGIAVQSAPRRLTLEGVQVRVVEDMRVRSIAGLGFSNVTLLARDLEVDLSRAWAEEWKRGVRLGTDDESVQPTLDYARITTGPAETVIGLEVDCAASLLRNVIVDVSGAGSGSSVAVDFWREASCPSGGRIHSSLFIGGSGQDSGGLYLDDEHGDLAIVNTLIDGGSGNSRVAVGLGGVATTPAHALGGTVVVLEGGKGSRDDWASTTSAPLTVDELALALGCPGCLTAAETVAHVDKANRDYHLSADSTPCIASGSPLDALVDLPFDLDGVPRPAAPERPAVGPFEYVP